MVPIGARTADLFTFAGDIGVTTVLGILATSAKVAKRPIAVAAVALSTVCFHPWVFFPLTNLSHICKGWFIILADTWKFKLLIYICCIYGKLRIPRKR